LTPISLQLDETSRLRKRSTPFSLCVRLKTAFTVLKQDGKLSKSTEFDVNSQDSDPLRNEMPPESPAPPQPIGTEKISRDQLCTCGNPVHPFDRSRQRVFNKINGLRNEMPEARRRGRG